MSKIRSLISTLLGLLALAALAVGLTWLVGQQGPRPGQQVSPLRTPLPVEIAAPTTEPIAVYVGVTASSKDWPTLTPPPFPPPVPSSTPRITPTPPVPPEEILPYDSRVPLRAAGITLAAVQPLEFDQDRHVAFKAWSPDGERFLFGRSYARYILVQFENGAAANGFWYDLWVADDDGSNPHKLADMVNSEVWSPDGRFVAYLAPAREQGVEGKLYVVDVEHLESREIAACDLGGTYDLAWLPTDEITCRQDGVIHAIKSDGSEVRLLNGIFTSDFIKDTLTGETLPPVFQGRYFISPDGKKMAFLRRSLSPLWVSNLDGTDVVEVKIEGAIYVSHDITWSPDSSQLAFSVPNGRGDGLGTDLWVVKADGTELRRVAAPEHDNVQFMDPTWSPDGKILAFTHRVYSDTEYESVWVMNADGTNAHLLVDVAFAPQWSPEGNEIAVLRERVISSEESLLISVNLGQQE